jgi:hypothetical protein
MTFTLLLAATGFADARERRTIARLWHAGRGFSPAGTAEAVPRAVPETIEGAGEIVAAVGADDDVTEVGQKR